MALSKMDKRMAALGGGMLLGGSATNQTVGKNNTPIAFIGTTASIGGTTTLGLVGVGEVMEHVGMGSRAQMSHYRQMGTSMGRDVVSSARRAAPGLKLLAGRIAQGANRII